MITDIPAFTSLLTETYPEITCLTREPLIYSHAPRCGVLRHLAVEYYGAVYRALHRNAQDPNAVVGINQRLPKASAAQACANIGYLPDNG